MSNVRRDPRLVSIPAEIKKHAAMLVREHGPRGAAKLLGVSRETALALASGLPCMPGTLALARESMRGGQ